VLGSGLPSDAHVSRLLEKLEFNNRVQIALLAHDAGESQLSILAQGLPRCVYDRGPRIGYLFAYVVQSCQLRPATRLNSEVLAVTTVSLRRSACPAISRS
jgi:hypothetical protein